MKVRHPVSPQFLSPGSAACLRAPGARPGAGLHWELRGLSRGFLRISPVQVPTSTLQVANLIILSALHSPEVMDRKYFASLDVCKHLSVLLVT